MSDKTELKILKASARVFSEKGPMATTRDIAKAAGCNEVTIFRLFKNKLKLFETTLEWKMRQTDFPRPKNHRIAGGELMAYFKHNIEYQRLALIASIFYPQLLPNLTVKMQSAIKAIGGNRRKAALLIAACYGFFIFDELFKIKDEDVNAHNIFLELVNKKR